MAEQRQAAADVGANRAGAKDQDMQWFIHYSRRSKRWAEIATATLVIKADDFP